MLALGLCFGLVAAAAHAVDAPPSGIAVIPFGGSAGPGAEQVASRLAERLGALSAVRVVAPSKTGAGAVASLEAVQVRAWAERLAVDSIVLGRVDPSRDGRTVEIYLRSGHSGGPVAQHRAALRDAADLDRVATELAEALLADLGIPLATPLPGVAAPAPETSAEAAAPTDDSEDSKGLFSLRAGDEPLSIDSDELELSEQGDDRHLIFRRNVRVTQGDIQLLTERLEAFYVSGSSQPDKLVATGRVSVLQGERRARCDRAVYRRADQTLECTGRAELIQRCDRVRGSKIQFDLERDRVRVLGGASVVIQPDSKDGAGCAEQGS